MNVVLKKVVKARLLKNSCKNACLEIENGTSKVRNSGNFEREKNANGNEAVLLVYKANLLVTVLSICLNGTLMMRRFLYCRKGLILFQPAEIYI